MKALREKLAGNDSSDARNLLAIADSLVRKSVWILGGDGWAFDIGFGGLDHVLGSGKNVNVLVLDTEVYSNTGGQMSKATPRGAVAKFAASGKKNSRKDLAMEAVSYGSVYVAQVALGGNDSHVVKAFQEAEAHDGPSIIIAYSSCIAHGYDLVHGLEQQKLAVQSGYWPLMRYNPDLREEGKNPFQLDSKAPSIRLKEYAYREARYTMLARSNPELAAELLKEAQDDVERQWRVYSARAAMPGRGETPNIAPAEKPEEKLRSRWQRLPEVQNDRFLNAVSWLEAERTDRGLLHADLGDRSTTFAAWKTPAPRRSCFTRCLRSSWRWSRGRWTKTCRAARIRLPSRSAICPT